MGSFLSLDIVDGKVGTALVVTSITVLAFLLAHRVPLWRSGDPVLGMGQAQRRWYLGLGLSALGGAALGIAAIWFCEVILNLFGAPLEIGSNAWAVISLAAVGVAGYCLWKSRWWRKIIAGVAIVLFLSTAVVGINVNYGHFTTVASLLRIDSAQSLSRPKVQETATPAPSPTVSKLPARAAAIPLWQSWTAPTDLPAAGKYEAVTLPNTASGFAARPAYLYLPPAALVANPPELPVLIMMMGQPGGPEDSIKFVSTLNALAAANKGLGPIVLTIDQIGSRTQNPLCIDSPMGNVHTYVMADVITYVRANLHVTSDRRGWAVGGYSNGGECALSFGAQHPQIFGSILDVSGEIGPSLGSPQSTLATGFAGDQARYDAEQPLNIMAQRRYPDTFAIFTSGGNDHYYGAEVDAADAAAKAAGMTTLRFVGPGVGHRSDAVLFGMPVGLANLYPRWGLSAPK